MIAVLLERRREGEGIMVVLFGDCWVLDEEVALEPRSCRRALMWMKVEMVRVSDAGLTYHSEAVLLAIASPACYLR
jgi:hypothetical protein